MDAHDFVSRVLERQGALDSVFWVACGGSLIDLLPAHEFMKKEATTVVSAAYTAREFAIMRPRRLGKGSLVVACSHSGNTPEVVDACLLARRAGATVLAMTDNGNSRIAEGPWETWIYPWYDGVPQSEVPAGMALMIATELLDRLEGRAISAELRAGIAIMDEILPAARLKVDAELCDRFAALCKDHEFLYVLGSGPTFSQTYGFAICSLMEMQWQNCAYIHSGEYFHGPFEVTEPGVFYFLQMSAGPCRVMDERARAFLETHTDALMILDARDYGVAGIPEGVCAYLEPIFFYAMNCELRAARGREFGHDPAVRRYMGIERY